jgi:D-proline reductase (dithiol) PrdB
MSDQSSVRYIERTRQYYRALGYERDYRWARNDGQPFARLKNPLTETQISIVVTSAPPGNWSPPENAPPKEVWSGATQGSNAPKKLYNENLAWDKESTHTRDRESYLPINALQTLKTEGLIKGISAKFHSVPTVYSHRTTVEHDAPEILSRVISDHADAALLVPL